MVEGVNAVCDPTLCFTHACNGTTKMQHPKVSGWRRMQVLMLLISEISSHDLAKVMSKHPPHTFSKSPSQSLVNCAQLRPSSSPHLACLHLSSHTFAGSASPLLLILTGCTSFDRAQASFDALLLESRVVCCEKMQDF